MFSPTVWPVTVSASRCSSGASSFITAGMPPASNSSSIWYWPDGRMLAMNGVLAAEGGRTHPAAAAVPSRPASATRWMTAFVEPPIAIETRIAFSSALRRQDLRRAQLLARPCSTIRRPLASARRRRRESGAGMAAQPGSVMPSASASAGHRRWRCPSPCNGRRCGRASPRSRCTVSWVMVPARSSVS